jgi:predicted heme/steroid binding protein
VLSLDELELYVGLEGGMFLVYDIYDIANQVKWGEMTRAQVESNIEHGK